MRVSRWKWGRGEPRHPHFSKLAQLRLRITELSSMGGGSIGGLLKASCGIPMCRNYRACPLTDGTCVKGMRAFFLSSWSYLLQSWLVVSFFPGEELLWRCSQCCVCLFLSQQSEGPYCLRTPRGLTFFCVVCHGLLLPEHSQVHPASPSPCPFTLRGLLRPFLKASKVQALFPPAMGENLLF